MLASGSAIGRYVVKRRLAEGGMAEVYLAEATGPEGFAKDVVIKVVRSFLASDQQFVDMFIAEARLSSRLNHANVVQIFDFGKHDQSYFIAMEYVRGASLFDLRKRCREQGVPFPPTLVAEIGAQVARGLQYAHGLAEKGKPLGIVHRDVTPHNVLLSFDGAVKLTDFGIAKASTTHTAPGVLKGKFAYMSPEQSRGESVDARTDVFALGVVLWEMLTGGRLFDGDSELAVLRAVQESLIAPPSRLNPDVPPELSDVVLKALARPVGDRFQSAFELERALATYVLRAAKSVEDTSVALFLQQVYRDEPDTEDRPAPLPPPEQRGVVPQASSFGTGDTLAVDRSQELAKKHPAAAFAPTHQREPVKKADGRSRPDVKTDLARAAPVRTAQMPGVSGPLPRLKTPEPVNSGKTDQLPAHRPRSPGTDVVPEHRERRTDPERKPLGADLDNSAVRLSDSMRLDAQNAENSTIPFQKPEPPGGPTVRVAGVAQDPTVLKPRSIELNLDLPSEHSAPTAAAEPTTPHGRPRVVLAASLVAGLLAIAAGGWALVGRGTPEETTTVVAPATPPPPLAAVTPPPLPPVPEAPLDAGEAIAALPTEAPARLDPAPTPPPAEPPKAPEPRVEPKLSPEPKPVVPAAKYGSLVVKAIPFAELVVDGRKPQEVQGTTRLKLPIGKHRVSLKHPKKTQVLEVMITEGEPTNVDFNGNAP